MGKRPAETGSFEGNMSVMQWTRGPSMQRGEPPVMETGLERIAAKARCEPKVRFTSLTHHVTRERIWGNLCAMPSKTAPGVDGQTVGEAQEEFKAWVEPMLRSMHRQGYPAPAVRRVHIPKPGKNGARARVSPRARRPRPDAFPSAATSGPIPDRACACALPALLAPAATPAPAASRAGPSPRERPGACVPATPARAAPRGPSSLCRTPGRAARPPRRRRQPPPGRDTASPTPAGRRGGIGTEYVTWSTRTCPNLSATRATTRQVAGR